MVLLTVSDTRNASNDNVRTLRKRLLSVSYFLEGMNEHISVSPYMCKRRNLENIIFIKVCQMFSMGLQMALNLMQWKIRLDWITNILVNYQLYVIQQQRHLLVTWRRKIVILWTCECSQGSNPQGFSVRPWVEDRGVLSML